MDERKLCN